jgi:DNA-binding MarR family transcriptional regulator
MKPSRNFQRVHVLSDASLGQESRAQSSDHSSLRLWLRLLSCSTQLERQIRARLRERFGTTLPRFDFLAQLDRHPDGLRMSALSRNLMVTGGNVTIIADQLVADGWVERTVDTADRRSSFVKLTAVGRRRFQRMAAEHEAWLIELLSGFERAHRDTLYEMLGRLRVHLSQDAEAVRAVPSSIAPPRSALKRQERIK